MAVGGRQRSKLSDLPIVGPTPRFVTPNPSPDAPIGPTTQSPHRRTMSTPHNVTPTTSTDTPIGPIIQSSLKPILYTPRPMSPTLPRPVDPTLSHPLGPTTTQSTPRPIGLTTHSSSCPVRPNTTSTESAFSSQTLTSRLVPNRVPTPSYQPTVVTPPLLVSTSTRGLAPPLAPGATLSLVQTLLNMSYLPPPPLPSLLSSPSSSQPPTSTLAPRTSV